MSLIFSYMPQVSPHTLRTWGRILEKVPLSRLVLKSAVFDNGPRNAHVSALAKALAPGNKLLQVFFCFFLFLLTTFHLLSLIDFDFDFDFDLDFDFDFDFDFLILLYSSPLLFFHSLSTH